MVMLSFESFIMCLSCVLPQVSSLRFAESEEVSKSTWSVFWGPRNGGNLGDCTHVQFFYQLQQMFGICIFNVRFFGHGWTAPNSHTMQQWSFPCSASVNCLRVAKRQPKSKSRGSLVKAPHPKTQPAKQKLPESERNFISLNASWKGK